MYVYNHCHISNTYQTQNTSSVTGRHMIFILYSIPAKYQSTILFTLKSLFLSKVKNRFNQDNYSKTYNQISFILYVIL